MSEKQLPGTTFDKRRGKWKGQYRKNGKTKSLGYFESQLDAYEAVRKAKAESQMSSEDSEILLEVLPSYLNKPASLRHATDTIAQSNVLIDSPWAMTLMEARLFVLMLRGLRRDDPGTNRIVVPLADLVGEQPIGGRGYKLLHAALNGLDAIRIDLPMPNRQQDYHKVPLAHSLQLDSGAGTVSGYFSADVMPYLTSLVDNFTLGQVADLLSIRSVNTHRYYWLMQMWKFKSPHTVAVEELRRLTTGGSAYPQYSEYRKNVLKPSLAELNELNFEISVVENKVGRSVDSVEFHISYVAAKLQSRQLQLPLGEPAQQCEQPSITPQHERVAQRLRKLKLTEAQIKQVIQVLPTEAEYHKLLKATHPLLVEYETKSKPFDNIGATAVNLLKTVFPEYYKAVK
ncbi:replication initiation protein [Hymenobacter aerophilus]|uniref:replication initiation protein n=1 Tax=Hymenobacter aerophilus TaxID=119644 RepID=UPI00035E02D6|nr:replication initiation protein [Hymenobacter aerophilus]